jgi:hypothetical protein
MLAMRPEIVNDNDIDVSNFDALVAHTDIRIPPSTSVLVQRNLDHPHQCEHDVQSEDVVANGEKYSILCGDCRWWK